MSFKPIHSNYFCVLMFHSIPKIQGEPNEAGKRRQGEATGKGPREEEVKMDSRGQWFRASERSLWLTHLSAAVSVPFLTRPHWCALRLVEPPGVRGGIMTLLYGHITVGH